jgi:predicted HicB family RNase H-like nuclease
LFDDFLTRNNRAMEKRHKTERTQRTLRLPPDLDAEVEEAAARAGRSMNDEIVFRLRAYTQATTLSKVAQQNAELKRMVQQLIDRLC